jgi:hypothetical protein
MFSPASLPSATKKQLQAYIDILHELISVEEGMIQADVISDYQSLTRVNTDIIMARIARLEHLIALAKN